MVAYSFKARFAAPITAGTKRQTIRAPRKRHARPGEEVQLYTGMRTRQCRLVGRATCRAVRRVQIEITDVDWANYVEIDGVPVADLDAFARSDGFADWSDMVAFWRKEHPSSDPDRLSFSGVMIEWGDLIPATPTSAE